jgi:hypothetical protein
VHVKVRGYRLAYPDQELAELDRPVAVVHLADDRAHRRCCSPQQAGNPMPQVVMGAPLGPAGIIGSTGWDRSRARTRLF